MKNQLKKKEVFPFLEFTMEIKELWNKSKSWAYIRKLRDPLHKMMWLVIEEKCDITKLLNLCL